MKFAALASSRMQADCEAYDRAGGVTQPDQQVRMPLHRDTGDARQVVLLLTPGFCFYAVSAAIEAFAMANRLANRQVYRWRLVSADQRPVLSSAGITLECDGLVGLDRHGLSCGDRTDVVIVTSDLPVDSSLSLSVRHYLRGEAEAGTLLAGIGRGTFLLAEAGLLDGRRCAVHWQHLSEMRQRFAKVHADCHLYEVGDGLLTSAGHTAALDLILSLIRHDLGSEIACGLCDQHVLEQVRPSRQKQRQPEISALVIGNPRLAAIIALMRENLSPLLPLSALARKAGMSRRQVERLFELEGLEAPTRFYLHVRLEKAQQLLRRTQLAVVEVGKACGFISASHFSKCYRKKFGHSPKQEREWDCSQ